ncbi:glycosyltransferase [Microbacterium suwonense]|uniref:Glycosyl transferase family 1 n=1 Tax=Microbacterium suwonense TaxID=683047 RepID=A0ABM8FUL4_9MICO|nr:glycosyltransferase [Microbacterium suwonense]BDZ39259.1 glycosyl transferase family 1 [Microbacterium suwonense]
MKILGVVTLVSPDGEYGGPLRVAVNQLRELADRGHDVVLSGSCRGYGGSPPTQIEGIPTRLFPARTVLPGTGFAGLTSPGLLRGLRAHVREFDVVHVHAARDLVTLPAARIAQRAGVRTVLQTHGMIDESANPLAVPLDAAITRRALRDAAVVTYLTPAELRSLEVVGRGAAQLQQLTNGVPIARERQTDAATRSEVLYLARLAPRKNPALFAQVAADLAAEFPQTRFRLVGPDEGVGAQVRDIIESAGLGERLVWEGALAPEETLERMLMASVYVLPSIDEPYPMSVLEAMSVGLPVIVTDSCGLAGFVAEHRAGAVIAPEPQALRNAIRELLADPAAARAAGRRGREAVTRTRSMSAVGDELERLYTQDVG